MTGFISRLKSQRLCAIIELPSALCRYKGSHATDLVPLSTRNESDAHVRDFAFRSEQSRVTPACPAGSSSRRKRLTLSYSRDKTFQPIRPADVAFFVAPSARD